MREEASVENLLRHRLERLSSHALTREYLSVLGARQWFSDNRQ